MTARIGEFEFTAPLWLHPGGSWYFVTVPAEISADIRDLTAGLRHGFGSVRVAVTVGRSSWRTSVFPDSKSGSFVLPVKKPARTAERLTPGAAVEVTLELADL
jgi:hypothetical protein